MAEIIVQKEYPIAFVYGFMGAEKAYSCLGYAPIYKDDAYYHMAKTIAYEYADRNPACKEVYVVFNRRGLKRDFQEGTHNANMEARVIFHELIAREGFRVK